MSALTEKVAREHMLTSYDDESGVWVCNCGLSIPADLEHMEHIAYVTEAATRAAVAADIRAEVERIFPGADGCYLDGLMDAARIAKEEAWDGKWGQETASAILNTVGKPCSD